MRIGFFTDTYFPQVSGVATSIKTLKEELEKHGHEVYIFTTTDPNASGIEPNIIRMPSVPFVSFKDRRVVVRGMWYAYLIARELELDLIHTHTEFGAGFLGKLVGKKMRIPVIHTYHTMYEDYLHYIAHGKVIRPVHVKYFSRMFVNHSTGVVCPSQRVIDKLRSYGGTSPMRIIPTGIDVRKFSGSKVTAEDTQQLRASLGITEDQIMLLSLSRLSYEKNIQALIQGLPAVIEKLPQVRMVIVGKGPYQEGLEEMVTELNLQDYVQFTGEISNNHVTRYYKAADYFISASRSETQGLTYTEAMAAGTQSVLLGNDYLEQLLSDVTLGVTYKTEADFPTALVDYIHSEVKMDPEVLANKMYEISSEHFGESILEFYNDMIDYYQEQSFEKEYEKEFDPTFERLKVKLTSLRQR